MAQVAFLLPSKLTIVLAIRSAPPETSSIFPKIEPKPMISASSPKIPPTEEIIGQPSYPAKARTGDGSGLVLCVPKQSPQNTVHLYSIHVNRAKAYDQCQLAQNTTN